MGNQIPKVPRWTVPQLRKAISESRSIRQVCFKLGLCGTGGNYETIKKVAAAEQIDLTGLPGCSWMKGLPNTSARPVIPLVDILTKDSHYNASTLKRRLVALGLLKNLCGKCGCGDMWVGEPLSLQLHHINGDRTDNRIENLMVLCPNCHSQTGTYAGKGKRKKPVT